MYNTLLIPDIHGRDFWKEAINKIDLNDMNIVFLGDYLDPYQHEFENMSKEEIYDKTINNFKEILEFKKSNPENVKLLIGNHDLTYLISRTLCDCRCMDSKYKELNELFIDNKELFDLIYIISPYIKNVIVSHAGIHKDYLDELLCCLKFIKSTDIDTLTDSERIEYLYKINDLFKEGSYELNKSLGTCSYYRGGYHAQGSLVWSDIREWIDDKNIEFYQIFGHTLLKQPVITKDYACIDTKEALLFNDDKFKFYHLDNIEIPINIMTLEN